VHANSPDDALARLETLALCAGLPLPLSAIRRQLVSAIDAIVQVRRGRDGRRVIVSVAELGQRRDGRTHKLLTRVDGRLAPCEPPSRPARRSEVDISREWLSCAS
jgi:Flp pilus assembly CpaF family ATPase